MQGRQELKAHLDSLKERLKGMAPVNRALGLGRVPRTTARVLRHLDKARLLETHLWVVGTNALFAYESGAGIFLGSELLATADADFLWDARQRLALVARDVRAEGVLGILRRADRSFEPRTFNDFRAYNKEGFCVDLIRPGSIKALAQSGKRSTVSDRSDDLHGAPIYGLEWLVSSPRFTVVAMGDDGYPLRLVTVDPRAFSLHKVWVAAQDSRDPVKKQRDVSQAKAVAALCTTYLGKTFESDELQALPRHIRDHVFKLEVSPNAPEEDPLAGL